MAWVQIIDARRGFVSASSQILEISSNFSMLAGQADEIEAAGRLLGTALRAGAKVLFCGNGGSAADAQHLAAELTGRYYIDRDALPAEALHCNTSYITAVGND